MTKAVTLPIPIPPLPQDQKAETKAPRPQSTSMSNIVAVVAINNDMYAYSAAGNIWHITANPFSVTQLA